jgi:ABC-type uncharacterized transport system permease subunit
MSLDLHTLTAAVYLAASVLATLGLSLRRAAFSRSAVAALAAGAILHAVAFFESPAFALPPRNAGLPGAVDLAAWLGTLVFLGLVRRARLHALAVLVAPAAFLGVFFGSFALDPASLQARADAPAWAHAHVVLASAGFALLGVAGAAGLLYLAQHRSLKRKTRLGGRAILPPLEALDRVNVFTVSVGFLLLSLALVTGVLWTHATTGVVWPRSPHANAALVAWAIYAALVGARFLARQGAAQSARSAAAGFAFLVLAVLGVGVWP